MSKHKKYPRWINKAAKQAIKNKNCNHNWDISKKYNALFGKDIMVFVPCKNCTMVKIIE